MGRRAFGVRRGRVRHSVVWLGNRRRPAWQLPDGVLTSDQRGAAAELAVMHHAARWASASCGPSQTDTGTTSLSTLVESDFCECNASPRPWTEMLSSFPVAPAEGVTMDSSGGHTRQMRSTWSPDTALSSTALIFYRRTCSPVGQPSSFACRLRETISDCASTGQRILNSRLDFPRTALGP
jgi:hypothetical protein